MTGRAAVSTTARLIGGFREVPPNPATGAPPVLVVEGLRTEFPTKAGLAVAVDDLSFLLYERETLAVVGESGSGKSVTALSILGLIPASAGRIAAGTVQFGGRDLLTLDQGDLHRRCGRQQD